MVFKVPPKPNHSEVLSFCEHAHPYPYATPKAVRVALDLPHETEWENHTTECLREGYSKNPKAQPAELLRRVHLRIT